MIRIRSELVKYFFLRRQSVGVLPECNFLPYTAEPHIASIGKEGLMGFQFGVHVLADLGALITCGQVDTRVDDETWSKHANAHDMVECRRFEFQKGKERKHTVLNEARRYIPLRTSSSRRPG